MILQTKSKSGRIQSVLFAGRGKDAFREQLKRNLKQNFETLEATKQKRETEKTI